MTTETPRTDEAWEAAIEEVSADGLWSAAATDMRELARELERENTRLMTKNVTTLLSVTDSSTPFPIGEARETLCLLAQLVAGWKATTPTEEWSHHDEECATRLGILQRAIECDHNWEMLDDSSDVEPAAPYYRCRHCDEEKGCD